MKAEKRTFWERLFASNHLALRGFLCRRVVLQQLLAFRADHPAVTSLIDGAHHSPTDLASNR